MSARSEIPGTSERIHVGACVMTGLWLQRGRRAPVRIGTIEPAPGLGSTLPHLHRDGARAYHISIGDWGSPLPHLHEGLGLTPATSAQGRGSPLPHLHRDGGSPPPHLHRDWAHSCHIYTATGLTPATSTPRLGSVLPPLHRYGAHPCHIGTGTGLAPARICIRDWTYGDWAHPVHICTGDCSRGLGSTLPHLHRDWAHPCTPRREERAASAHRLRHR